MKMKAAVMTQVGKPVEIREVELAEPKAHEVLVKILATAVCHSDLNTLEDPTTPIPQVLGHEGAGQVVSVGPYVTTCKPGDYVTLSWVPYCGTCAYCRAGKFSLCESAFGPMVRRHPDGRHHPYDAGRRPLLSFLPAVHLCRIYGCSGNELHQDSR